MINGYFLSWINSNPYKSSLSFKYKVICCGERSLISIPCKFFFTACKKDFTLYQDFLTTTFFNSKAIAFLLDYFSYLNQPQKLDPGSNKGCRRASVKKFPSRTDFIKL